VGDRLVVMEEEREAREIAAKRQQILREQTMRKKKHVSLDDISRRMALGELATLKLILKADVAGSLEALADSLLKLSTDEVAVEIIHSGVGAINESDVMLAAASDAIIFGFQVRPMAGVRQVAEREEIDIRLYSRKTKTPFSAHKGRKRGLCSARDWTRKSCFAPPLRGAQWTK
jgi:translation initiation factor IF-2